MATEAEIEAVLAKDKAIQDEYLYANSEPLSDGDRNLMQLAASGIEILYEHGWHQVYGVGIDEEGKIFTGLQLDEPAGDASICAEPMVIARAAEDKRVLITVVAVRRQRPDEGKLVHVIPPCGTCRIRLFHHNPLLSVIVWLGGKYQEYRKVRVSFLYPSPTKRRRKTNGNGNAKHEF